ncbi:hypothetical protein YC2023_056716 [Brassica napus]
MINGYMIGLVSIMCELVNHVVWSTHSNNEPFMHYIYIPMHQTPYQNTNSNSHN